MLPCEKKDVQLAINQPLLRVLAVKVEELEGKLRKSCAQKVVEKDVSDRVRYELNLLKSSAD